MSETWLSIQRDFAGKFGVLFSRIVPRKWDLRAFSNDTEIIEEISRLGAVSQRVPLPSNERENTAQILPQGLAGETITLKWKMFATSTKLHKM